MWRADLSGVEQTVGESLSSAERERAARFARPRERELWVRSHGVLRSLLGRYLHADPGALRFATGAHGKPALLGEWAQGVSFNLSHSRGLALYALATGAEVGVDVECARERGGRRQTDLAALGERVFGSAHARRLRALDHASREREFLRLWTRHEAVVKCRGDGFSGVAESEDRSAEAATSADIWVVDLEPFARAAGAVASAGAPHELCCWDWG